MSVATIASVEPQVTVISVSGFTVMPYHSAYLRASASRSRREPQVMAYWFMSSAMARAAASLRRSGRGKIGEPLRQVDGAVLPRQRRHARG